MKLHIANFYEADRRTAVAGEDLALGAVVAITGNASNERVAKTVTQQSEIQAAGAYGIAFKVSSDPLQVTSSTVPSEMGTREVTIKSGDYIVECRKGTIMEYDPSLLHASLDPARSGALPAVGAALAISGGLPCTTGTAGAITTPVVLRVYDIVNGKVRIELL